MLGEVLGSKVAACAPPEVGSAIAGDAESAESCQIDFLPTGEIFPYNSRSLDSLVRSNMFSLHYQC